MTGSCRGLIYCTTSVEFAWRDWGNPRDTSDRIAGDLAEIRTVYLSDGSQSKLPFSSRRLVLPTPCR